MINHVMYFYFYLTSWPTDRGSSIGPFPPKGCSPKGLKEFFRQKFFSLMIFTDFVNHLKRRHVEFQKYILNFFNVKVASVKNGKYKLKQHQNDRCSINEHVHASNLRCPILFQDFAKRMHLRDMIYMTKIFKSCSNSFIKVLENTINVMNR